MRRPPLHRASWGEVFDDSNDSNPAVTYVGCPPLCTAAAAGKRNDDDGGGGMGNDAGLFTLTCTAVFADWNPRRLHT